MPTSDPIIWFDSIGRQDGARVGGKNASLGEMASRLGERGIATPPGFATTTDAFWVFVDANQLREPIAEAVRALEAGRMTLAEAGQSIRAAFLKGEWPQETARAIETAYLRLCRENGGTEVGVAVRSSATAEDLPHASFAGQQETFLNVRGAPALLAA